MKLRYGDEEEATVRPTLGDSRSQALDHRVDMLLIEDKGSGISLRQMLAAENIHAYANNSGRADKLQRPH